MKRKIGDPCFDCGCGWYDSAYGCTCSSIDKWYLCPIESEINRNEILKEETDNE